MYPVYHSPDSLKSQELKLTLLSMPGLASLDIDLIELSLASEKMGWSKLNIEAPRIEQNLELSVGSNDLMISNNCQNDSVKSPLKTKYLSVQSVHELSPIVSMQKNDGTFWRHATLYPTF